MLEERLEPIIDSSKTTATYRSSLRLGFFLEIGTVVWNVIEGIVAVWAGTVAGSVALVGFGIDSFIETTSALVVGWRLNHELAGQSVESAARLERRAARVAGGLLILLSVYVAVDAVRQFLGSAERAEASIPGIVLTVISLIVMPVLAKAKLKVAAAIGSRALRADAYQTICCTWLSITTLGGLALNALFGWWWADSVAALILVPIIAKEGLEAFRGTPCGCTEKCN